MEERGISTGRKRKTEEIAKKRLTYKGLYGTVKNALLWQGMPVSLYPFLGGETACVIIN